MRLLRGPGKTKTLAIASTRYLSSMPSSRGSHEESPRLPALNTAKSGRSHGSEGFA